MRSTARLIGTLLIGAAALGAAPVAALAQAGPAAVPSLSWPRDFDHGDQRIEIYQPQVESWNGDHIAGRAAIAVGAKEGTSPTYAIAEFSADADIDKTAGLVRLHGITIDKVDAPSAPDQAAGLQAALQAQLPAAGMTVALDHLQTSYA
ncbi:hypothetical protein AB4212_63090, partial [Streptomyces sp. 2MCAF27]